MRAELSRKHAGGAAPARVAAYRVLEGLAAAGSHADELFEREASRLRLDGRDRALTVRITREVLKHGALLDRLSAPFLQDVAALPHGVMTILRMVGAQRHLMDRIPAHAIVGDAVELAKREVPRGAGLAGLVNAVSRRIVESAGLPEIRESGAAGLALEFSLPHGLAELMVEKFGMDDARQILERAAGEPSLTLRVSRRKCGRADAAAQLQALGVETVPTRISPDGLVVADPGQMPTVIRSDLFRSGALYFQDDASQCVGLLAASLRPRRVLDLCAAPGGKCTHLADILGDDAVIVATDLSDRRLDRLRENIARLGSGTIETRELERVHAEGKTFDLVLVDAPCSGLGTLSRCPEVRLRWDGEMLAHHGERQRSLLASAAPLVAPGGALLYSTCSFTNAENSQVVASFLAANGDFQAERPAIEAAGLPAEGLGPEGQFRSWPAFPDMDGFEMFVMRRNH